MLHYMRSLLPGYPDNPLFEAIFIDLLPANARDAAVKHDVLEDMAEAADKVLAEAPATALVTSVTCPLHLEEDLNLAQVARSRPQPTSSSKKTPVKDLCYIHINYGRNDFNCASPKTCKMCDVIARPDAKAPGNANAGRQ